MDRIEQVMRGMTLEFFGSGRHKIAMTELIDQGGVLLDVRSDEEARVLPLPLTGLIESVHIPIDQLPDRVAEAPKDRLVGTFCSGGVRAVIAYAYLLALGYDKVRVAEGGYEGLAQALKPGKIWKRLSTST